MNIKVTLVCLLCCVLCEEIKDDKEPISLKTVRNSSSIIQRARDIPTSIKIKVTGLTPSHEKPIKPPKFVCPDEDVRRPFFSVPCKETEECHVLGNKNMVCCKNRCVKGVPGPPPEPVHSPVLFGLVKRVCPSERIPEIFEITKCSSDSDCSPRICCPEKMLNGEIIGYCRTAEPKLDNIPVVRSISEPLKLMMSYMQCTPPPPPILDVFPKECTNPLDCFPNLCCQERGKRFCRPPKRSLLTLLTTVAQRFVPTDTARDIINRLTT